MSFLPEKNYEWVSEQDLNRIRLDPAGFLSYLEPESPIGYFFEVDLEVYTYKIKIILI